MTSSHSSFRRRGKVFIVAWLFLAAYAAFQMLTARNAHLSENFSAFAEKTSSSLARKLASNDAVLNGFSAFLGAISSTDTDAAARFAAAIKDSHPHIYMIEIARRVPLTESANFQQSVRTQWRPNFTIQSFGKVTGQTPKPIGARGVTWPILFLYPDLPEAQSIYGVALETVDYLGHALALSDQNAKPVSSPIFMLYEGGGAYILLKEINAPAVADKADGLFGKKMMGMLIIRTEDLKPRAAILDENPEIRMVATLGVPSGFTQQLFEAGGGHPGFFETLLLPKLTRTETLGITSQPTHIDYTWQLRFRDYLAADIAIPLILLLISMVAVPWLILEHLAALAVAEFEHNRSSHLATHDVLTGLPNRVLLQDRAEQSLLTHERSQTPFALMLIDLDRFKLINDRHGHEIGDVVLKTAAERMAHELRASDTLARYGGDEFIVLLTNINAADDAQAIADKLVRAVAQSINTSHGPLSISCSIGVALCPENGTDFITLLKAADQAMYAAKHLGKNRAIVCSPATANSAPLPL